MSRGRRRGRSRRPRDGGGRGLRIIGGDLRGRRLVTPPTRVLRPMREQVREALFNILGPAPLEERAVLDLFAGSGSLGLEALSRGAARACFVDRTPPCLEALRHNAADLGVGARADVVEHDLAQGVGPLAARGPFDLVFVHPPFELLRRAPAPDEPDVVALLRDLGCGARPVAPTGATVAFETPREWSPDALRGVEVELRREYGSTALFVGTVGAGATTGGAGEPEVSDPG